MFRSSLPSPRRPRALSGLFALVSVAACSGAIGPGEQSSSDGGRGGSAGRGGTGGSRDGGRGGDIIEPGGGAGGGPTVNAPSLCEQPKGLLAGPAPLTRLSNVEYRNTIRDLFPKVALDAVSLALPAEVETQGYLNTARTQTPSAELIEALQTNAAAVAKLAVADLSKLLPCTPANTAGEPACGKQFLAAFGKRAFRRPLTTTEQTKYETFFTDAYGKWGFASAVRMVVEAFLQSPKLVYRVEGGGSAVSGSKAIPLDPYELATRLSYFLTDTMPDDALLSAAETGKLANAAGVETEARRLMALPKARTAVAAFHEQWLRFEKMNNLVKAKDVFPSFAPEVASSLKTATAQYVDYVFWDGGHDLKTLLTDDHAYVDARVAPFYGATAPSGTSMSLVTVDRTQRSGVLTQAGLLAGFAHERNDAPVLRGVFVLDRFLCMAPPSPPATVNTTLPDLPSDSKLTTRQQLERSHVAPACASCHKSIDGIGFGFENYDALGAWRTKEFGLDVDATGELVGTRDVDGQFKGVVELGSKLASSTQVPDCLATHWLSYALAVPRDDLDGCMIQPIADAFAGAKYDLRELLIATVKSDAFRHRPAP